MQLLQCTATPPGGGGPWSSYNAQAHQLGRRGVVPRRRWLLKERNSCNALPHCPGAVGSGTLVMHYHTAQGQWAVGSATPAIHGLTALGAVGSATPAIHRHTAVGCWALDSCSARAHELGGLGFLPRWRSLPKEPNSYDPPAHCLGVVRGAAPAMQCLTAWRRWAVRFLQCTAPLPGGSGHWNFCHALPHCLGAGGSGTPAIHGLTAWR